MQLEGDCEILRIFTGESDRFGERPLYEVIVEEARRRKMAGATVVRGIVGFGTNSAEPENPSNDVPIVVEIVDKPERIAAFLPDLDQLVGEALVTVEKVRVVTYRRRKDVTFRFRVRFDYPDGRRSDSMDIT